MKGRHIAKRGVKHREQQRFLGHKLIIVNGHQAAIPLWSRAKAAKSSKAQAQLLRPIRGKCSQARPRRQTAAKFFVTGIRRFTKAHAILWQKLYAYFSEHTFDQGNRVLVSRVATHLNIRDRVSMQTGRLSQVPNRPIQRSTPSELVRLSQARIANVPCDKVRTIIAISPNQGGTE